MGKFKKRQMMKNIGWNKMEFLKREELDKYAWHKGFFQYQWNPKIWKRNFNELKLRDISLFNFGDFYQKKILDIGCGEGLYMLTFFKMGASYTGGQDISTDLVEKAISICNENGFNPDVKVGDCTQLYFENNTFDLVFSGDVFEHITEDQKNQCIAEIFRVLKPGGLVTIKTPNLDYLKLSVFLKRLYAIFKFSNPFKIHIAHTKNNPDNEHHGLTTYKKLIKLLINNTFHEPTITYHQLERKSVSVFISKFLKKNKYFNEHIIMTARKPIFYGLYD